MRALLDDPVVRSMERTGFPPWMHDDDYSIPDEAREPEEEPEAEAEETAALIEVRQLPIIAERLYQVKEQVEMAVAEAASMICTDETVQAVKNKRAELRKQFDELETQRKAVKAAVMGPYDEFEKVYKECISVPFKSADASMKATIDSFENELKERCKADLQEYFTELCAVHGVDFLTLDQAMSIGKIRINLSDAKAKTPRQLQDAISEVVARIADGMDQINRMNDSAEIMAEYKLRFDVGAAVATVQGRKRRIEAEKEAAEARRTVQERQQAAIAKVDAVAPPKPVEFPTASEKRYEEFVFTVFNCTRTQLIRIREYLKQEGISYK